MKKHIVCFGDSNTHGYCGDPADSADGGDRFNEDERYTCLLQKKLGPEYLVIEEGLGGRTSVFEDPLTEGMSALPYVTPMLMSHEPVDLLIIMLGTNDTKERFGCNAACIGVGMGRLLKKAKDTVCWRDGVPKILLVCPPAIREEMPEGPFGGIMGDGCVEKSRELPPYMEQAAAENGALFLNAAECEFNDVDYMHLTRRGHSQLAELLFSVITSASI